VDRIDMAQCRDKWQTLLNMLMRLQIPCKVESFLTMWGTQSLYCPTDVCVCFCLFVCLCVYCTRWRDTVHSTSPPSAVYTVCIVCVCVCTAPGAEVLCTVPLHPVQYTHTHYRSEYAAKHWPYIRWSHDWTISVTLVKYSLTLPDDESCVVQNVLE
jgi:hypothetical protein